MKYFVVLRGRSGSPELTMACALAYWSTMRWKWAGRATRKQSVALLRVAQPEPREHGVLKMTAAALGRGTLCTRTRKDFVMGPGQ